MSNTLLRNAIRNALRNYAVAGASIALGSAASGAVAQNADQGADQKSQSLETIVVTGSNIRRVDIETANPVVTIDAAAIQNTGKLTLGDIVQSLPANVNGTNPQVNNGGGSGSATISLRGLGTQRTLVLIDGHLVLNRDIDLIPIAAVERIEILTAGASAMLMIRGSFTERRYRRPDDPKRPALLSWVRRSSRFGPALRPALSPTARCRVPTSGTLVMS